MYLHVGEDTLIRTRDIIAILNKDSALASPSFKEFLENGRPVHVAKGTYKSIVVTVNQIYYSPLAAGTLKKRSKKLTVQEF